MSFPRYLVAGSVVAVLALAGCSAGGDEAEPSPEPTEAATDPSAGAPEADLKGLPDVIAIVNDEEIDLDEFTTAYEPQLQQAAMMQQQSGQEIDQDQLKKQVADMLISTELLTQAADEKGIDASDKDVDGLLKQLAEQNGLKTVDEVIAAFDEQGFSEEDVREDAADQVRIEAYVEAETNIAPPNDDELRAQYDTLVEQAKQQGGEGEIPPFEQVKKQLADQSVAQEQNAAIEKIVKQLRENGNVEIKI